MADKLKLKDDGGSSKPHDAGTFTARCVDLIRMGQRIETWPGSPTKIVDKMRLAFATDAETEPRFIFKEFSESFNSKSALRLFAESWRGKPFTPEQLHDGVEVDKMVGVPCMISVIHKTSGKGNQYAVIQSVMPLAKGAVAPDGKDYKRPDFVAKDIEKYAAEVSAYIKAQERTTDYPDQSPEEDGDSDLPFDRA